MSGLGIDGYRDYLARRDGEAELVSSTHPIDVKTPARQRPPRSEP